jgi:hypothetical protein
MATTYCVLHEDGHEVEDGIVATYSVVKEVEALNAGQACRKVAEQYPESDLDGGVTLIAVPARNWNGGRHTLRAETTRRIRATS